MFPYSKIENEIEWMGLDAQSENMMKFEAGLRQLSGAEALA